MAWRGEPAGGRESAEEQGTPFGGVCLAHTHVAKEFCRLKTCEEIRVRRKEKRGVGGDEEKIWHHHFRKNTLLKTKMSIILLVALCSLHPILRCQYVPKSKERAMWIWYPPCSPLPLANHSPEGLSGPWFCWCQAVTSRQAAVIADRPGGGCPGACLGAYGGCGRSVFRKPRLNVSTSLFTL